MQRLDRDMLHRAAHLAARGMGCVEPNPMVGCIIGTAEGRLLGAGHHRAVGGPHAEVDALANCRERGCDPSGATAWVTLEPCHHTGRTGPCTCALIDAGVARVVIAQRDPHPDAMGGLDALRAAGVRVDLCTDVPPAIGVGAPFVKRVRTGLPWVIAKWAQTIDGRIATRTGESQWITGPAARRHVHSLRARVDVILTGIGTVRADDPMLTARDVPIRRIARRVVIDPDFETPTTSALVGSVAVAPLTIFGADPTGAASDALRRAGADVHGLPIGADGLDLEAGLRHLVRTYDAATVMTEAGPRLLGGLLDAGLIDEAWVYVGGKLLGDPDARPPFLGRPAPRLASALDLRLVHTKRLGDDVLLRYGPR